MVIDNSHFGLLSSVQLSLVATPRVEAIFKLSDGTTSRTLNVGTDLQIVGPVTIVRDSVIIINDPRQPLAPETFSFILGATIVGLAPNLVVIQREVRGLVEVTAPPGKTAS